MTLTSSYTEQNNITMTQVKSVFKWYILSNPATFTAVLMKLSHQNDFVHLQCVFGIKLFLSVQISAGNCNLNDFNL